MAVSRFESDRGEHRGPILASPAACARGHAGRGREDWPSLFLPSSFGSDGLTAFIPHLSLLCCGKVDLKPVLEGTRSGQVLDVFLCASQTLSRAFKPP